jgi:GNAT superfamily N-acetyltransferase
MNARKISFDQILPIWQKELWPNRQSAIETHSAMTWPYSWPEKEIDMEIFNYDATFFGVFSKQKLIGVNSGHKSSEVEYRSRGIWVDPAFRKTGVAQLLFNMTAEQALNEECEMIWSIPRKTALKAYTKFGFMTVGDFFNTETSDANIYVLKRL